MRRPARYAGFIVACAFGLTWVMASEAPRLVSLSPHITELLFAAGAGDRLVAVDSASDYPPAARVLPRVGEAASLDVEALLALRPTQVIVWRSGTSARTVAELERLKLPLYFTEQRRLDDIGSALLELGRMAGTVEPATRAADRYRTTLTELRRRFSGRPRLTVFYQVWDRPLYTLSGRHVVGEVLSLCGGENIFGDLAALAPSVDRESVVSRNPDVILIGASGPEAERQSAEWRRFTALQAVRDGHVYSVDPSLVNRMSPRILDGVEAICQALDRARIRAFPQRPQENPAGR